MKKTQDLSVEEILTSIRGIVQGTSNAKVNERDQVEDILELTELHCENDDFDEEEELISENVIEEASEALRDFKQQASKFEATKPKRGLEKTVEELMVGLLRPEIKKWLDINLPSIVRQLVDKEIKRLTPKDRGDP